MVHRRSLGVLLGAVLAFSLAACSDDDKAPPPPPAPTSTATAPSTATRTATATTQSATRTATTQSATRTATVQSATPTATAESATPTATTPPTETPTTTLEPTTTPTTAEATATATTTEPTTTPTTTFPTATPTIAEPTATATVSNGTSRIITTIAGTGVAGFNGDGRDPLQTHMYLPQDTTVGPDGLLYLVDWNNHRIRRIKDGVVETIAGTGELGDAKDGDALYVQFNHPTNVCFDHEGRMIVAAWHNSLIKRIDMTTGYATTIAGTGGRAFGGDGGPGLQAIFDLPSSVVVDSSGDVIISDQANYRIRVLDQNGMVSTICGDGTPGYTGDNGPASGARLNSPKGQSAPPAGRIDIDSHDRIYIADTGNHVVRIVDAGTIRTIAGTGVAGYSGDGGPATAAQLNTPSDVAVSPDGSIYIADTNNNVIRMIDPQGIIHTVAGTGERGYSGDGGPADVARLDRPYGVSLGPDGTVYVADTHNHRYRRLTPRLPDDYDPNDVYNPPPVDIIPCTNEVGSICTYAGTGQEGFVSDGKHRLQTVLYWPLDIEFTPNGREIMLDWNNHKVREILADETITTIMGTDFVGDGPLDLSDLSDPGAQPLTVNLNHPTDIQQFPNGDILVATWHNHKLRQIDAETGLVRVLIGAQAAFVGDGGPAKDARVNQPPHIVLDPNGNLFLIDQRNQRIRVIYDFANQRQNAIIRTVVGTGQAGFNGDGVALQTQVSFPTGPNPEPSGGLTLDHNGVLYFSDTRNNRIRRVEFSSADFLNGVVTTIAGTGEAGYSGDGGPATAAKLNFPEDLEIGPDGNIYFADANNNVVRMIDVNTGIISTVAGTGEKGYSGDGGPAAQAKLNRPFGVAFDENGDLYISDSFNSRVRKVKLSHLSTAPEPVFPSDYRSTFEEVRNCRFSIEHGGVSIRVLANPIAAQGYLDEDSSLPTGSIVVKEEYSDADCNDNALIGWRVMRKEDPGFDPQAGDWHWQHLTASREVLFDTKATCIGCHVRPACMGRDFMCTENAMETHPLDLVLGDLPAALYSVSGTSQNDVYVVGADPGDGKGPQVYKYNGQHWRRLITGAAGDLWWISTTQIGGAFYMSGENGLILRYEPDTGTFVRQTTPGTALLYGIWGTAANDIWAVGGNPGDESTGGVIWHYDGTTWSALDLTGVRAEGIPTLYKVWGRFPAEVYAVGRLGVILRWNGTKWSQVQSGSVRPLFTIHGNTAEITAVGGFFDGVILELAGTSFANRTPDAAPQFNGVFLRSDSTGIAVGREGGYALRDASGWHLQTPVDTPLDFHATWIDPQGGTWAVGGDLSVDQSQGIVAYGGAATIGANIVDAEACILGTANAQATVTFANDIAPLFGQAGCLGFGCHSGAFPSNGFDLTTFASTFSPGAEAIQAGLCPIVPGDPDASYLVEKLGPNPRLGVQMPNGMNPLTAEQIALVRQWVLEGAAP